MRKPSLRHTVAGTAGLLLLASGLVTATPASAGTTACPAEPSRYTFTNVRVSIRPTNLYSAYITGPGHITYSENKTATATASMTATVQAEAGVVFAKASASLGVTVGASYSFSGGFSYTLPVPSGQRRRMRLFQESRYFVVTKKYFSTGACKWYTSYSSAANAPKRVRDDAWRLEA